MLPAYKGFGLPLDIWIQCQRQICKSQREQALAGVLQEPDCRGPCGICEGDMANFGFMSTGANTPGWQWLFVKLDRQAQCAAFEAAFASEAREAR